MKNDAKNNFQDLIDILKAQLEEYKHALVIYDSPNKRADIIADIARKKLQIKKLEEKFYDMDNNKPIKQITQFTHRLQYLFDLRGDCLKQKNYLKEQIRDLKQELDIIRDPAKRADIAGKIGAYELRVENIEKEILNIETELDKEIQKGF